MARITCDNITLTGSVIYSLQYVLYHSQLFHFVNGTYPIHDGDKELSTDCVSMGVLF